MSEATRIKPPPMLTRSGSIGLTHQPLAFVCLHVDGDPIGTNRWAVVITADHHRASFPAAPIVRISVELIARWRRSGGKKAIWPNQTYWACVHSPLLPQHFSIVVQVSR
jgi:hypothetical protein